MLYCIDGLHFNELSILTMSIKFCSFHTPDSTYNISPNSRWGLSESLSLLLSDTSTRCSRPLHTNPRDSNEPPQDFAPLHRHHSPAGTCGRSPAGFPPPAGAKSLRCV